MKFSLYKTIYICKKISQNKHQKQPKMIINSTSEKSDYLKKTKLNFFYITQKFTFKELFLIRTEVLLWLSVIILKFIHFLYLVLIAHKASSGLL